MITFLWIPLLVLMAGQDPAPFGFRGVELYKASTQAQNLLSADFNGDGRLDFALSNAERSRIEIFVQKSDEERKARPGKASRYDDINEIHDDARFKKVLIPLESTIHAMVAADLDGDGRPEIATRAVPSRIKVWKRMESGKWEVAQKFKIKQGRGPRRSLLAADLNEDSRLDLALLEKDGVSLFFQNDAGRLKPPEFFPTALRDATGLDLVRPEQGPPALVLYRLGNDNGLAVRPLLDGALGPEWIYRSGKMKTAYLPPGEKRLAILTVMSVSNRLHKKAVRSRTNQEAAFETPLALYPVRAERGAKERGISVGDLDGDGRADVVVSRPSASTLNVYLQGADGFFKKPSTSSTFADTTGTQVGDFDGDGRAEVLVVSAEEQVVGLAAWKNGRLTFPKAIAGNDGKPHAAAGVALLDPTKTDLAVVTDLAKKKYTLIVRPGFSGKAIQVKLPFLKVDPIRLLALDIDADGDQDLAVITKREAFGLVLNEGGGKFTALGAEAFGGKWLLKDVDPRSYTKMTLAGGREAILVAKKTVGRAVGLDKNRKLVILEQIAAGENVKLTGIARSGDEVVVVDEKSASLLVLRKREGEWKRVQEIELPSNIVRRLRAVALSPGGGLDLIVSEKSGFIVIRRGNRETRLDSDWSYESEVKDARLWQVTGGDLNGDGRPDLAVTDHEKRALEILVPPAKAEGKVRRALRFEIFEEKRILRSRTSHVREMIVADLTGDRKEDLLFLLHDRVVLYPQE